MATETGSSTVEWVQLGVALIAGGAMGAFINAGFSWWRDRLQPIGYRIEELSLFDSEAVGTNLVLKATEADGWTSDFNNMHIVELLLVNNGTKDFAKFKFGITLPRGDVAVRVVAEGADRHHTVEVQPEINWRSPVREIDFNLHPFNRKDTYAVRIFAYSPLLPRNKEVAEISSAEAVKFVRLLKPSDISISAEIVPLLGLGPIRLGFNTR